MCVVLLHLVAWLSPLRKRAQFQQFEDMDPRDWKDVAWAEWRKHNTMCLAAGTKAASETRHTAYRSGVKSSDMRNIVG